MIQVDDLRFTYPGSDEPALRGLGFEVDVGRKRATVMDAGVRRLEAWETV